jgi:hypothetical protein
MQSLRTFLLIRSRSFYFIYVILIASWLQGEVLRSGAHGSGRQSVHYRGPHWLFLSAEDRREKTNNVVGGTGKCTAPA